MYTYYKVSICRHTWAVSLDLWPNCTWGVLLIWFQSWARTLCPSCRIDMAELHVGAMFSTVLDLQTVIRLYVYMQKTKCKRFHVYLELNAKRAWKTDVLLDLFVNDTACKYAQLHILANPHKRHEICNFTLSKFCSLLNISHKYMKQLPLYFL